MITDEQLEELDKKLRQLRYEVERDLLRYGNCYVKIPNSLFDRWEVIIGKAEVNIQKEEE